MGVKSFITLSLKRFNFLFISFNAVVKPLLNSQI
jgi:hypothetical protein